MVIVLPRTVITNQLAGTALGTPENAGQRDTATPGNGAAKNIESIYGVAKCHSVLL